MEAVADGEREVLTYEGFGAAVRELGGAVVASGWEPDWILCIARGGLLIGGALGYALSLKNIATLNVEFYTDVDERLDVPVVLPPVLDLVDLANARVLVADDVADTGETLEMVVDLLRPVVAEVRSAVLYEKSRSSVHPDYVWRRTDAWINFPWSTEPPLRAPDRR
jgi:hypoxanthine phosphoribosyltransferase